MEFKPNLKQLIKREILTLLTISLAIILGGSLIHLLVVVLDSDTSHQDFVYYVWPWIAGAIFLLWLVAPYLIYLWITNLSYSIEAERVVIYKGIITKKHVNIPFRAVTDLTLSRSLYERWLGIGTILIQTAGQSMQTGGYEGRLEGLTNYGDIQQQLREHISRYSSGNNVPQEPKGASAVLEAILAEVQEINKKLS